eukprot:g10214.t1
MLLHSRRIVVLALVAVTALLAPPISATTTESMVTDTAADQETEPYYSDTTATDTADNGDTDDEPVDSGLECSDDFLGDGQCDDSNNMEACGYDGGDCCECTCSPRNFNCGGNYNCIDPSAECVEDDDGDGGVMTTAELETDDITEEMEDDADVDADTTADAAVGLGPRSLASAGLAAAAGAAVVLAGWAVESVVISAAPRKMQHEGGSKPAQGQQQQQQQQESPKLTRGQNHPLVAEDDILRHLIPFVAENEGYLFVAGVASTWARGWVGEKTTKLNSVVESASRLESASTSKAPSSWAWTERICARAAAGGHLGALKYARRQQCPWDVSCCREAAAGGHLSLLRWCHQNGAPWNKEVCSEAARRGDLDLLRWARRKGCPWDKDTCSAAAGAGELEVLKWARNNGCDWDADTTKHAARGGHLELLRWARSNGCDWDAWCCTWAAGAGEMGVLRYCWENACPWNKMACAAASREGHLDVLEFLRAKGCSWDEATCTSAIFEGHLNTLRYARENDCPWDPKACRFAAEMGHLEVLAWCKANGAHLDARICISAAGNGHLEILKWARANGCAFFDEEVIASAASGGHLDVVKYCWAQRCPWNEYTTELAAEGGHLEVLKWCRSKGCPWDEDVVAFAAEEGHMEVMNWAIQNGCPWDKRVRDFMPGGACALVALQQAPYVVDASSGSDNGSGADSDGVATTGRGKCRQESGFAQGVEWPSMTFWRRCGRPMMALLSILLDLSGAAPDDSPPRVFQPQGWLPPVSTCPESCDTLFSKLDGDSSAGGQRAQHVKIQERGEPQSGLSFMFEWASETLGQVCVSSDSLALGNHAGLLRCMDEAACAITDDRVQMAVFRDPRATAASLFFRMEQDHYDLLSNAGLTAVDDFFLAVLPALCKWTSVRHRLFAEALAAQSTVYWYDDVLEAPLKWQYNLLYYLGLNMPAAVVEWVVHVVTSESPAGGFFATADARGDDERPVRGKGGALAASWTYRDEVSTESLRVADHILRVWLPPVLQEKLGVSEA